MGIAITIAIILSGAVILFSVGLSLETLRHFSGQDSLLENFMFAPFKRKKQLKTPCGRKKNKKTYLAANSSPTDTLLAQMRKRG